MVTVARYDGIRTPSPSPEEAALWNIPVRQFAQKKTNDVDRRAHRNQIKKEDLLNVVTRTTAQDPFEDDHVPEKAIVLKMPERCMKAYFIPLPVDLDVNTLCFDLTVDSQTSCGGIIRITR